jgi:hypothetical protein
MLSVRNHRFGAAAVAVALLLALATPAHAAGPGTFGSLWARLAAWVGLAEAGSMVAVSGRSDVGPNIDPDGRSASQADKGSTIDPNGQDRLATDTGQGDKGSQIDPDGKPL